MSPARIDALTDAQRATLADWTAKWVAHGHRAIPLTGDEWDRVIAGVRDCYRYAGLDQPVGVILTRSPLAARVAVSVARRVWAGVGAGVGAGVEAGVEAGVWAGVGDGVWAGVGDGVGDGVGAGVRAGVGDGVGDGVALLAAYPPPLHRPIRDGLQDAARAPWDQYYGGNLWCSWHAFASWFRDVGHLDLPGDLWDRLAADEARATAGPSYWYADFVAISDTPTTLHVETVGGATRMHCGDGPAIAWADGFALHFWHGTRVPADLIETGWDTTRIIREENAEIRRCAVEVMAARDGWDGIIREAGWEQVGHEVADPGNPGQTLSLWHVPAIGAREGGVGLYDQPVRLLRCTNGTVERDGQRHEYGLTVDARITDPVAAAAWTYNVTPEQYASLQRAT
ncbi:MAG TPA: hypothetical protein VFJ94_03915 [Intrasporangium sp.]|uniref:DUF6745 domain-containing protein n=1 Tax=Intrasporangium sp. TaxID=1925024 RepID=UPI002D789691|nr:hypothetical protein [Intrasporangium sp.]HET7397649.1 hypothetical protein [Intrasporangium sp.]